MFSSDYTENECKCVCTFIATALQRNGRFVAMIKKRLLRFTMKWSLGFLSFGFICSYNYFRGAFKLIQPHGN